MMDRTRIRELMGSQIEVVHRTRSGSILTHTGTLESVGMKRIRLECQGGSNRRYRILIASIRSIGPHCAQREQRPHSGQATTSCSTNSRRARDGLKVPGEQK